MDAEKQFEEICLRCENHAVNLNCEDMEDCPAYKLYLIAKSKRKVIYKKDVWSTPPPPRSEMI